MAEQQQQQRQLSRPSRGLSPFFDRDPLLSLRREMDDLMSRFWPDWDGGRLIREGEFAAPLDLSETDETYQIRMDLPGIDPKDIDIEVSADTVRISGHREEEKEEKGKTFHRVERRSGKFSRQITLPTPIKDEEIDAQHSDGVLTITLPKTEKAKTHKITVKGG